MNLNGKVALITGAASGIGAAGALLFAREGARVCLVDIDDEHVNEQLDRIEANGGEAIGAVADLREPDQVEAAFRKTVEEWGNLDIVWANAGINGVRAPIEEVTPDEWDEVLHTNLRGTFTRRGLCRWWTKTGSGRIRWRRRRSSLRAIVQMESPAR